jgi:hypothetical protein
MLQYSPHNHQDYLSIRQHLNDNASQFTNQIKTIQMASRPTTCDLLNLKTYNKNRKQYIREAR